MPNSSVLVAADAISNSPARCARSAMSLKTNSAIGERHILPWQTNRICIIASVFSVPPGRSLYHNAPGFLFSVGGAEDHGGIRGDATDEDHHLLPAIFQHRISLSQKTALSGLRRERIFLSANNYSCF